MRYTQIDVVERYLRQRAVFESVTFETGTNAFCTDILIDVNAEMLALSRCATVTRSVALSSLMQARL
jgi:hypothetical protein